MVHTVTDEQLAALRLACDSDSYLRLLVLIPPATEDYRLLLQEGMRRLEIQREQEKKLQQARVKSEQAQLKAEHEKKSRRLERLRRELENLEKQNNSK